MAALGAWLTLGRASAKTGAGTPEAPASPPPPPPRLLLLPLLRNDEEGTAASAAAAAAASKLLLLKPLSKPHSGSSSKRATARERGRFKERMLLREVGKWLRLRRCWRFVVLPSARHVRAWLRRRAGAAVTIVGCSTSSTSSSTSSQDSSGTPTGDVAVSSGGDGGGVVVERCDDECDEAIDTGLNESALIITVVIDGDWAAPAPAPAPAPAHAVGCWPGQSKGTGSAMLSCEVTRNGLLGDDDTGCTGCVQRVDWLLMTTDAGSGAVNCSSREEDKVLVVVDDVLRWVRWRRVGRGGSSKDDDDDDVLLAVLTEEARASSALRRRRCDVVVVVVEEEDDDDDCCASLTSCIMVWQE